MAPESICRSMRGRPSGDHMRAISSREKPAARPTVISASAPAHRDRTGYEGRALHYAIARAMTDVPHLRLCEGVLLRKLRARVSEPGGSLVALAQSLAALALRRNAGAVDRLRPEPGRPLDTWYGSAEWSTVFCLEPLLRTA